MEVFQEHPTVRGPWERGRLYISSGLERLRIAQEDLENAAVLKEVWNNLLSLLELRLWISGRKLWINSFDAFKENGNYGFKG